MLAEIKRVMAPPVYADQEQARKAGLLNTILWTFFWLFALSGPIFIVVSDETRANAIQSIAVLLVSIVGLIYLMKRGRLELAYNLLLAVLFVLLVVYAYIFKLSGTNVASFIIVILLAALLVDGRAAVIAAAVCSIVVFATYYILTPAVSLMQLGDLVPMASFYIVAALLLRLAVNSTSEALELARRNELAFAQSNQELEQSRTFLEQRVAERTRDLTVSVEVSRRLSTILDPQQLAREIVEQMQTAFNYYHVHIYLFDERGESLVMVGGTGEAGRAMLGVGHRLGRGRGLVGRAAESQQVVLVPDVTQEPVWLPNPLLPETRAEMAVPIAIGGRVLGVLDVQQNVTNGLQEKDIALVQSLANQVAVALQNARLYTQAQLQAERETMLNNISQRIQRATTIEATLQVAAEELGRTMGASRAIVQLTNPIRSSNGRGQEPA